MEQFIDALLTPSEELSLLGAARSALESYVDGESRQHKDETTPAMREHRAAFVTLRANGLLRGCIGSTLHAEPLVQCVQNNTVRSASADPRFDPLAPSELHHTSIEISVLGDGDETHSPFVRIEALNEIQIGRDGIFLERQGSGGGLLLPQVAAERAWSPMEFAGAVCRKAGLDPDAWKNPGAALYRFSAQVFAE